MHARADARMTCGRAHVMREPPLSFFFFFLEKARHKIAGSPDLSTIFGKIAG